MALVRSPFGRLVVGWILGHMSFAIPVNRLRETKTLIAFHHPRPSYPVHILLVPKKAISELSALAQDDIDFLEDLFGSVKSLVAELELDSAGYRLVVNGGQYQEFPHLHFHLISGT